MLKKQTALEDNYIGILAFIYLEEYSSKNKVRSLEKTGHLYVTVS